MKIINLLFALLLLSFSVAQFPQRQNYVVTDSSRVDVPAINRAAEKLARDGIEPLLMLISAPIGDSYADVDAYLQGAMQHYDLATFQGMVDEGLLVLIGTSPLRREGDERPVYLRYGAKVAQKLDAMRRGTGRTQAEYLRENVLVPALREGDYTKAFTNTLQETGTILSSAPAAAPTNRSAEAATSQASGGGLPRWLILAIFGGIFFFVVGAIRNHPQEKRNEKAAKKRNAPAMPSQQGELQKLKSELSTLLIDLSGKGEMVDGHDAYLPHDPEQQTDFVLVQSLAALDRPEMVENLRARYGRMRDQLEQVEQQFSQVSNDEPASKNPAQMKLYTSRYQKMLEQARETETFTKELASTWEELNNEVEGVRQRVQQAESALESLEERYRRMLAPKPNKVSTFAELEGLLAHAKQLLAKDRPLQSVPELDAFENLLEERSQDLKDYPLLVQRLPKRLEQMDTALAAAKLRISEGAESFDKVDDFAESSWRDIRGNGSSAEQHLRDAHAQVSSAKYAHSAKDFLQASDDLRDAQEALGKVDANISAIETRLRDLQQARANAHALLRENRRDYAVLEHRAKADNVEDAVREVVLQVNTQLEYSEELADSYRPDWTEVLQQAQAVDKLMDEADKALAEARDKQATLQRRMQSEREEARIALDRISHYVRVHPELNEDEVERLSEQAELSFVQAEGLEHEVERAISLYDQAEQDAKRAYQSAEALQQRLVKLQRDMQQQLEQASRKWQEASRLVQGNRAARHLRSNLESLERSLPVESEWRRAGTQGLVSYLEHMRRLNHELDTLLRQARQLNSRSGANLPTGLPRHNRPSPRVQIPIPTGGGMGGTARAGHTGSVLGGVLGGVLNEVIRDAMQPSPANRRNSSSAPRSRQPRSPQPRRQSHRRNNTITMSNLPSRPNRPIQIGTASARRNASDGGGVSKGGWKPSSSGGVSKGGW